VAARTTFTTKQKTTGMTLHNYFAIGAMLNPVSLRLRNIHPVSSRPAKLPRFRLHFFGEAGMAEALPAEGSCLHGVIHVLSDDEAHRLDVIEAGYDKHYAKAVTYDGTDVEVFVYCRKDENIERGEDHDNPPSERYLQILSEGAEHFGVDPEYINFLQSHPFEPRTKPNEYLSFDLPGPTTEIKTYSKEEIEQADGKDGRPFMASINGKVIRAMHSHDELVVQRWVNLGVNHFELVLSKNLYDPQYGEPPTRLEKFTRDHCACIEDFIVRRLRVIVEKEAKKRGANTCEPTNLPFACVGRFQQTYKDESFIKVD